MSSLLTDNRIATVLDLHQASNNGRCPQCRTIWPCTTFIALTGSPHQTIELVRGLSGLLPMAHTLIKQIDQVTTPIDPEAFTAAADLLTKRNSRSDALELLLDLIRTRSTTLKEMEPPHSENQPQSPIEQEASLGPTPSALPGP